MKRHVVDFDNNVAWQTSGAKPCLTFGATAGFLRRRHCLVSQVIKKNISLVYIFI